MLAPKSWAAAVAVALWISPASAAPPASTPTTRTAPASAEPLEGRYRFAGGRAEVDALHAAIDEATADMGVITRAVARRRLRKLNSIPAELRIDVRGNVLSMTLPDAHYTAPLDGTPVRAKSASGDPLVLQHELLGDAQVRQRFRAGDGERVNVCRPHRRRGLRISVQLASDKLPQDLRYTLTFARID